MRNLEHIEGIGSHYAGILKQHGIDSLNELLSHCAQPKERQALAEKTEISPKLILKWANQADLARINGIGEEYGELLERSGVDTVPELAQRNPGHLLQAMQQHNEKIKRVRRLPSLADVEDWVKQAKDLPRALFY